MVLPPRHGLSLCSGGGGLDMGLELAEPGFAASCYVEIDDYPRETLIAAQRAGYMRPAPIWDDLKTFDARPWRGHIDTLLAGYPCQPFSQAGSRKGENDPRHLWPDIERIIGELGDGLRWCFFENVAGHLTLGLETVVRSLRGMGFTVAVGAFSAAETGATHERLRVFIVAHREQPGLERQPGHGDRGSQSGWNREEARRSACAGGPPIHPPGPNQSDDWSAILAVAPHLAPSLSVSDVKRTADNFAQMVAEGRMEESEAESALRGMAASISQRPRSLRLLGNAVHPLTAAYAWRSLALAHGLGEIKW